MNNDVLKGQWQQLQGRIRQRWGRLTDTDLGLIQGDRNLLMSRIQGLYGHSRQQTENDLDDWLSIESVG